MSDDKKNARSVHGLAVAARLEEMEGEPQWIYLSFADTKFLGGFIVKAFGFMDAVMLANEARANPGGEIRGFGIPEDKVPPEQFRGRLLTKEELKSFWPDVKSVREWKAGAKKAKPTGA